MPPTRGVRTEMPELRRVQTMLRTQHANQRRVLYAQFDYNPAQAVLSGSSMCSWPQGPSCPSILPAKAQGSRRLRHDFWPTSVVQLRRAHSRVAGSPHESCPASAAGLSTRGGSTTHPEGIAAQHTT